METTSLESAVLQPQSNVGCFPNYSRLDGLLLRYGLLQGTLAFITPALNSQTVESELGQGALADSPFEWVGTPGNSGEDDKLAEDASAREMRAK